METEENIPFIPPLCNFFPKHVLLLLFLSSETSLVLQLDKSQASWSSNLSKLWLYFVQGCYSAAENTGNIPGDSKLFIFSFSLEAMKV